MQHEKTMYGLCDCNNFFASCERVFRPELEGLPVVVLSNNDGCVIARSNEAKALGIRMGHPYFQIRDLEKRHNVAVFSSNFNLYGDMSRRVIWTLRRMVPAAEVYSIDEAFLDLRGIETGRLEELGRHISRTVRRNTGIPVSIGIAPTKTLAKIASKLCKEYPKLQGACLMYRPQDIEKVLRKFPIEDVWGIGRKHRRMLQAANVRTAWDFVQRPEAWIRGRMGVTGLRTWKELQGEACIDFESAPPAKQQITVSRSFAHELTQYEEIHTSVAAFVSMAAEKLRRQQSLCGEVTVSPTATARSCPSISKARPCAPWCRPTTRWSWCRWRQRPCNAYSAKATATRKPGLRFRTFRRARGCKPTCSTPWIVPGTPG